MNEFLILFILKIKSSNIYEIKKFIDENFAPFLQVSTGAIIPALKRMEKDELIICEKTISEGGLRKTHYSILEKGEIIFTEMLDSEIIGAPQLVRREIEILINLFNHPVLSIEQKKLLKEKIISGIDLNAKILRKSIKNKLMNIELLEKELNHLESYKDLLLIPEEEIADF